MTIKSKDTLNTHLIYKETLLLLNCYHQENSCVWTESHDLNEPTDTRNEWNETHWHQKLLDLVQGAAHARVGFSGWSEDLDENVEIVTQMAVFSLPAFPQFLLLLSKEETRNKQEKNSISGGCLACRRSLSHEILVLLKTLDPPNDPP